MKKQKHMLRTCLFLVILFLLIFLPGLVLTPKVVMKYHLGAGRNAVYSRIANEPKNTIDVLVMGDSESYTSISPMKIWNETGYTVYAAGQPGANLADTRNVLKTAFGIPEAEGHPAGNPQFYFPKTRKSPSLPEAVGPGGKSYIMPFRCCVTTTAGNRYFHRRCTPLIRGSASAARFGRTRDRRIT